VYMLDVRLPLSGDPQYVPVVPIIRYGWLLLTAVSSMRPAEASNRHTLSVAAKFGVCCVEVTFIY
jgi:hypothetical protein